VKLPPGTFELAEPLVLTRGDTRIEGCGAATHLINRNESGKPALILRPKDRATKRRASIWRVQLADFRISGNPKSGDGLRAEAVNELPRRGDAAASLVGARAGGREHPEAPSRLRRSGP